MDLINNIVETTLNSFDFAFCIIVNVLTYIIIKIIDNITPKPLNVWYKRCILLCVISSTGGLYYLIGTDLRLLINSAILAPVFWSWIMKPICKHFNIDYKQISVIE